VIESFIAITRDIIAEDGLEDFLPTLMFPDRGAVHVLEDASDAMDHEAEALAWVRQAVPPQENYFLAYRADEQHFKVVSRINGEQQERLCPVGGA
jgi:hypothetical protein